MEPRSLLRTTIMLALLALAGGAGLWYWLFETGGREEIGFGPAVFVPHPPEDDRPALRVAIAAMVSPETTRRYYFDMIEHMADILGMRVVFLQRRTYAEVNELVRKKEVDVAFVCAGPYVDGHDVFGMEIIAVPVVGGEKVYHSYIIVPRESAADSLDDLRGTRFAFTDPDSNTGCLVPRYMLAREGKTPDRFFSETFFTHSHDNSIRSVSEGQSDGAAVDSLIYDFLKIKEPRLTNGTRVITKSPAYGMPPIVVHPDLDPAFKARIRDALFDLHKSDKGRALLGHLMIERFEPGDDTDYDEVRAMKKWVESDGESGHDP